MDGDIVALRQIKIHHTYYGSNTPSIPIIEKRSILTETNAVNLSLSSSWLPLCPGYSQARFSPSKLLARRKLMADLMKSARVSDLATMAMYLVGRMKQKLWIPFWWYGRRVRFLSWCKTVSCLLWHFELTGLVHWLFLRQTAESSMQDYWKQRHSFICYKPLHK